MNRIKHIIDIANQPHHMPALLSLLIGLFVIRNNSRGDEKEDELVGDNIPATLMERIGR